MSLVHREISIEIQLGKGNFGEGSFDTVKLDGLRCTADIVYLGGVGSQAQLQIYGMKLEMMNRLTVTQQFFFEQQPYNQVTVYAGDEAKGMARCFAGNIMEAWCEASQPPDTSFYIGAITANANLIKMVPPISFKGTVDAATVAQVIAQEIGYSLENSGVTAQLTNPYLPGSLKMQLGKLCEAAGCDFTLDDNRGVLAIWPRNKVRSLPAVSVTPTTGLVGYPNFTQGGIRFTTIFNPLLSFGGPVDIESQLTAANGRWGVYNLAHRLEANVPGGQWFSDVECLYLDAQR